jgi:hypothetical protein
VQPRALAPGPEAHRTGGPGSSIDAVAERVNALPFVVEGLMTVDHEEVHEIY